MSDNVKFEEEEFVSEDSRVNKTTPRLVRWVLKTGVVKNEKQASSFLLIVALVFFILSAYFFTSAF